MKKRLAKRILVATIKVVFVTGMIFMLIRHEVYLQSTIAILQMQLEANDRIIYILKQQNQNTLILKGAIQDRLIFKRTGR